MNKKGFTLIELLAVVAILAILAIIALPNVLEIYHNTRKNAFVNEIDSIIRVAKQQFFFNPVASSWSNVSGSSNKLSLSNDDNIEYYVETNENGEVIKLQVKNGTYQYSKEGNIDAASVDDVKEINSLDPSEQLNITVLTYVYSFGSHYKGDVLVVNNTNVFDNYNAAVSKFGYNFFLKHAVDSDNKIVDTYVGFIKNGTPYYIKGDTGQSYTDNIAMLYSFFGSECYYYREGTENELYICGEYVPLDAIQHGYYAAKSGGGGFDDYDLVCWVDKNVHSLCLSLEF